MNTYNIGIIVGSLRKQSYNKKIAAFICEQPANKFNYRVIEIGDLPLYNQDFDDENHVPESWKTFRKTIQSIDAILFVTPEYNRSVPAVLKNALDIGSRPYGHSVWDKKPAAIVSVSPGGISGFGANHHLRQSLVFLNMPTLQQPEAYIGHINSLIDKNGKITNNDTLKFFQKIIDAFVELIERYN